MADHSNQIGQEKVLAILGIRASQLPPPGEPLQHHHMRVLELVPGTCWKREDVAAVYDQLAQQYGAPLAVLTDGAIELREGAEVLKKQSASVSLHNANNKVVSGIDSAEVVSFPVNI